MAVKGKIAIITASASGIGKAIAKRFAVAGINLVISDIQEDKLSNTKKELEKLGVKVLAQKYDVGNLSDLDDLFQKTVEVFGGVDILINNAGIAGPTKSIVDIEPQEWDDTLTINLRSQYYCIKKVVPLMRKIGKGKIVNLSSQSGKNPLVNRSPYCASKMGVIGLTRCAAAELGEYDITVNAVCPGAVEGERLDRIISSMAKLKGISSKEFRRKTVEPIPLQRTIPPEDIAELVLFLSDDELSNTITGQDININSGDIMY